MKRILFLLRTQCDLLEKLCKWIQILTLVLKLNTVFLQKYINLSTIPFFTTLYKYIIYINYYFMDK